MGLLRRKEKGRGSASVAQGGPVVVKEEGAADDPAVAWEDKTASGEVQGLPAVADMETEADRVAAMKEQRDAQKMAAQLREMRDRQDSWWRDSQDGVSDDARNTPRPLPHYHATTRGLAPTQRAPRRALYTGSFT